MKAVITARADGTNRFSALKAECGGAEAGATAWLYHSEFEMAIANAIANAALEAAID